MDRRAPRSLCFLLLGLAIALGGSAWSLPLPVYDGFENAQVGSYPSGTGWLTLSYGKPWYGKPAYVSDAAAFGGSQSFRLDSNPWARQMDYVQLDDVPDQLSYEASVCVDPNRGWVGLVGFMARNGYYTALWNYFRIDAGHHDVSFHGEEVVSLGTYTPGTWCTVRADLDFQTETADVWLDGECVVENVPIAPKEFYDPYLLNVVLNRWGVVSADYLEYPYVYFANVVYFDDLAVWESSTTLEVEIDVKPGGNPNMINLNSKGLVAVTVFSTESFDATQIDPETVTFAGAPVAVRGKQDKRMAHVEDIDGDGLLDMVFQFQVQALDPAQLQEGFGVLSGDTYGGDAFQGSDTVVVLEKP